MSASAPNDDDEWGKSWTSNSPAAVLVDGVKLNDVFTMIRKQLEYLRGKQRTIFDAIDEINKTGAYQDPNDPMLLQLNALEEKVARLEAGDIQMLIELNETVHNNNNSIQSHMADMEKKLHALSEAYHENRDKERENRNHIKRMEESFTLQIQTINLTLEQQAQAIQEKDQRITDLQAEMEAQNDLFKGQLHDLNHKYWHLKDVVAVNEHRLKLLEEQIHSVVDTTKILQEAVDTIPQRLLEPINNTILDLASEKADKSDLLQKADVSIAIMKADISEITRLDELCNELARRVGNQEKDIIDGFTSLDSKLEKKSEKVAQWCLKQIRKELKNLHGKAEHDGTDIGRVRCLVCDQVVPQNTDTEYLHDKPYKNQIPPQRPRSASPPPGGERDRDAHHRGGERTGRPLAREGGGNNQEPSPHTRGKPFPVIPAAHPTNRTTLPAYLLEQFHATGGNNGGGGGGGGGGSPIKGNVPHSKLVRLGNNPNPASGATGTGDHPTIHFSDNHLHSHGGNGGGGDYVGDFKYRVAEGHALNAAATANAVHHAVNGGLNLSSTNEPAGLHITGNFHTDHPPHAAAAAASASPEYGAATHHTHINHNQFRDMDERFYGGIRKSHPASAKNRPLSAPMKRSATTGKLPNNTFGRMHLTDDV